MDYQDYLKFLFAFIFVLSLMGGLSYTLKRFGLGQGNVMMGHSKRLKIIETKPIDAKHKAVLLQRDDTQHLVLLGANGNTVIETNITPPEETNHDKK